MRDAVTTIVRHVGDAIVLPRWRNLASGDVREKARDDLVTVVDEAAEAALTPALQALLPDSRVLGEEAASADPALLDRVGEAGALWVVDPIDGTANFVDGNDNFAVMVGLLHGGVMQSGWIYLPARGELFEAHAGEGAFLNGKALARVKAPDQLTHAHAGISLKYTPEPLRGLMAPKLGQFASASPFMCAGREYAALATGEKAVALYNRLLPWDHVPGLLLAQECGCTVRHFDGTGYSPAAARSGLLVAASDGLWQQARDVLIPPEHRN